MRIKFYILFILLGCFFNVRAQKVDNDTSINNIKSAIAKFFIKQNILMPNQIGSLNSIYVTEIKEEKTLGYNITGIYRIGVFQSHSEEHVLIKENSQVIIFDIKQIDETLKEVINYSTRNKIGVDTILFYIKAITEMYDMNYKFIPNSASKMPVANKQP